MKQTIITIILMLNAGFIYSQDNVVLQKNKAKQITYMAKRGIYFYTLTPDNTILETKETFYPLQFTLPNTLLVNNTFIEVQFLPINTKDSSIDVFEKGDTLSKKLRGSSKYINSTDNYKRFFIELNNLTQLLDSNNIEMRNAIWDLHLTTGASISSPFKFRPKINSKNYIFQPEFALGPWIGCKTRLSRVEPLYLNILASAGINSVNLNDNVLTKSTGNDGLGVAFYTSLNAVIQLKDFQIGFVLGADFMGGEMGANWLYNEKPWTAFSIGYPFIKGSNLAETKELKNMQVIKNKVLESITAKEHNIPTIKFYEEKAFNAILDTNKIEAISALTEAEKLNPTYHNIYELNKLLNNNENWREIYKIINEKYMWGMTESYINKFKIKLSNLK